MNTKIPCERSSKAGTGKALVILSTFLFFSKKKVKYLYIFYQRNSREFIHGFRDNKCVYVFVVFSEQERKTTNVEETHTLI